MPQRRRSRITLVDYLMVALALVSVGLLAYDQWGPVTPGQSLLIFRIDLAIIAVFAVEFMVRWVKDDRPRTFPLRRWYELVGMIPVTHPAVRSFRLFRVLRIAVVLARFGRLADRTFGEEFTYRFLRRFRALFVEVIGDAIILRVLDQTLGVLEKGAYTRNLADAMEAQGDAIEEVVMDKVRADPALGRLRRLPFFEDIAGASSAITRRLLVETLRDPRMDQLVKDMIRQNVEQIRLEVARKESLG